MDANKIRTRETVTLSCRNEGCWRSDRIRNHSWHRSLHNYLSCCFWQIVLSREWSLSGKGPRVTVCYLAFLLSGGLQLQLWGQPMSCSGSGGALGSLGRDASSGIVRCYFVMVRLLSTLPSSLALPVRLVVGTR